MAKVSGSYPSVILGVSQQVPQDRRPGQHFEQINLISDPVRGLCRRHGSVLQDELVLGDLGSSAEQAATLLDTQDYKEYTFFVGPREFSLMYRTKAKPAGSTAPALIVYDKDKHSFVPVVGGDAEGPLLSAVEAQGVGAVVNVGRFVYLAPTSFIPTYTETKVWDSDANRRIGAVWIRTGAYSRTYKVTAQFEDRTVTASYTTPASAYPGVLDTSDIPSSDPDYSKKVTDRQSAYQTAVTQWIGTASAAVQPQNITTELMQALRDADTGYPTKVDYSQSGSSPHIAISIPEGQPLLRDIIVDDGGDGSAAWAVGMEVPEVARLSAMHYVGKVVRVRPKKANAEDAYYMKAQARIAGETGFAEVTWVEAAGVEQQPKDVFAFATVEDDTFYLANSADELTTISSVETPGFSTSSVGDTITTPVPFMFGKWITYMGMVQDRLLIASGSVLYLSKPGDYLNWYRSSVLTVEDDDPVEMFALGAEDDIISAGVPYDRSLVLFGRRKQYIINGRNAITPKTAGIVVMSSYEDATEANPVASGNFVFYAKSHGQSTSMHQIQTGLVAEAPETYEIAKQLDTYLEGRPVQILPVMAPNTLFLRTTGNRQTIYTYTYLDSADGGQRLFDAWNKWMWNPILGSVVAMTYSSGGLVVVTLRKGTRASDGTDCWYLVADKFTLETELSDRPYLDSLRDWTNYALDQGWLRPSYLPAVEESYGAVGKGGRRQFMGTTAAMLTNLVDEFPDETGNIWVGVDSSPWTYVIPTNPFIRDKNDKAIINGRLTIQKATVQLVDSGGVEAFLTTASRGEYRVVDWSGRTLGRLTSEVGIQPITTSPVPVPMGREIREFSWRLRAKSWLPLTITAIEWSGQLFYNARRV